MHPQQLKQLLLSGSCAAIALCASLLANSAAAETAYCGAYMGVFGGIAYTPGFDNNNIANTGLSGKISYSRPFSGSTPFAGGVVVGYKSGPYRYEVEGIFMRSNYKKFTANSSNTASTNAFSGDTKVYAGMANLIVDFDQSGDSAYVYIGAGGGYASVNDKVSTASLRVTNPKTTSFAIQGIVGFAYNFTAALSANIDYRYFITTKKIVFTGERYNNHLLNIAVNCFFG